MKKYILAFFSFSVVLTASAQTPGSSKWTYTAQNPISASAAAIDANGTIYFADWQSTMYALNPTDGSVKWTATTPNANILGESSPVLNANGTTVYYSLVGYQPTGTTYLVGGGITARSTFDGRELWHYSIPTNTLCYNPPVSRAAIGSDGTIYFVAADANFYAITSSGAFKWVVTPPGGASIITSPAIGPDGTIYVGGYANLVGYNTSGTQIFTGHTDGGGVGSPAIGSDGTIYVGGYGGLYAFNSDGTRQWKYSNTSISAQFTDSGPTIDENGTIYFDSVGSGTSYNSYLYAVNPDGTLEWSFATGETQSDGAHSSPVIVSDGTIYVGSSSSHKLFAVDSSTGSQNWAFSTGDKIYSPAAVGSDSTVYIGSEDGKFYAIYGSAPLDSAAVWPKFQKNAYNLASSAAILPGPLVAPLPPTGLTASATNSQIALNWNASSNAACYNIKIALSSGGPYTTLASGLNFYGNNITNSTFTNYTLTGLPNDITYYFVISAVGAAESSNSIEVSVKPEPPIPPTPAGLTATIGNTKITLVWNSAAGADSYNIKRSTISGGPFSTIGNITSTSYTNVSLLNGTNYYYVVSAVNTGGESPNSSQVIATPEPPIPAVPTGLTSTGFLFTASGTINLSWNPSTGATSYNVKQSGSSAGPFTNVASISSLNYTNRGLVKGTTYYYVVSAQNGGGESANSTSVHNSPGIAM